MNTTMRHVTIRGGMREFVGRTGTVQGKEGGLYRVILDTPVQVEGVGQVTSDLWEPRLLRTIRASKGRAAA
jgi:hypothetical protein